MEFQIRTRQPTRPARFVPLRALFLKVPDAHAIGANQYILAIKTILGIPVTEKENMVNIGEERKRKRLEDKQGTSDRKPPSKAQSGQGGLR
ncbi:unnamed protein product [Didymodactylos carnosus]|uniref:Uncharacterized protein n=1 Tax=Didymodactylos carnosus TaxID=1234261 RepID=A0A815JCR2_9BILA|nr:unnamed protein product [Didymodactylos carnosus]CAF4269649.1 unnamed protein product [Didymodactylos carnosus]